VRTSPSDREPLAGAGIADHEALAIETARAVGLELAPPIIRRLTATYGDRCAQIVRIMAEHSDWRMPLVNGQTAIGAEVIYVVRHEMACTLADIVIRRTELGAGGHPGAALIERAAGIAGDELEWDADRRTQEITAVEDFYRLR
jgi:glycerol-3-phosphate dehydrogenase